MLALIRTSLCAAALAAIAAPALAGGPNAVVHSAQADMTNEFVVKFRDTASAEATARHAGVQAALAARGVSLAGIEGRFLRVDRPLSNLDAQALAKELKAANPAIAYIEANIRLSHQLVPNDTRWNDQWHYYEDIAGIKLPKAYNKSQGAGVVVAVLDTGYRPHADLVANIVPGYDFITNTSTANDGNGRDSDALDPGDGCGGQSSWHGTHVAGTIAAVTNNGVGVAGIAPGAKIQPVRVLGCGGGTFVDIQDAIEWASGGTVAGVPANPTPARVINMSLSGSGACPAGLQTAINNAVGRGTVVAVAAGNNNSNAGNYTPANCANVITVASVNRSGSKAWYSNTGATVEIAAPGGDTTGNVANGVLSTLNAGVSTPGADSYAYYQGTSMATPHVAGVAALMLANRPTMTPAQVLARMQSTARAFPGTCTLCGAGILNAAKAVQRP
ncbi:S8 family peptidase [Ideonella sp. 4Y16]|uniref:S8 family peptidase n=1 Tax=Ideonella alba TaxID=2824118 RepID=A0A941BDV4_9BURK|nr:S8 family peptidase [Ideonella alba]MBQ0933405.1 S8 family peptidase [Ideonella alba]MBQ0943550.1 S8 family peptidase [Ideonella alba]